MDQTVHDPLRCLLAPKVIILMGKLELEGVSFTVSVGRGQLSRTSGTKPLDRAVISGPTVGRNPLFISSYRRNVSITKQSNGLPRPVTFAGARLLPTGACDIG